MGANQLTLNNVELGPIAWQVYASQNEMLTKMAQQAPKTELVSVPCAASPADTLAAEILAEEAPAQKRKR